MMSVPINDKNNWIRCFKPKPESRFRLFCFPPAGSGALFFRQWALEDVFSEAEIYSICLPGRESRLKEPLLTDIEHLVTTLLPNITGDLDKPFVFFGHSLGAIVGFEVVHQLQKQGLPLPLQLFVSARQAPSAKLKNDHLLPNLELKEKLRLYAGTPETVLQNDDLMAIFLPIVRADLKMNEKYNSGSNVQINCPISAFIGLNDPVASGFDMNRWSEHTKQDFKLHTYPGGHFPTSQEIISIMSLMKAEVNAIHN